MKKRRELDAIASRIKPKRNGAHELLRTSSFSSENEELLHFDRENLSNCYVLSMLFHLVIIIIAFASLGSLLWLLMQLKSQVKDLQLKLSSLSSENEAITMKLQDISVKYIEVGSRVGKLRGAVGEVHVAAALDAINAKITSLSEHPVARDPLVRDISKSVAKTDSTLQTLKHEVAGLQASLPANQKCLEVTNNLTQLLHSQLSLFEIRLRRLDKLAVGTLERQASITPTPSHAPQPDIIREMKSNTIDDATNNTNNINIKYEASTSEGIFKDYPKLLSTSHSENHNTKQIIDIKSANGEIQTNINDNDMRALKPGKHHTVPLDATTPITETFPSNGVNRGYGVLTAKSIA